MHYAQLHIIELYVSEINVNEEMCTLNVIKYSQKPTLLPILEIKGFKYLVSWNSPIIEATSARFSHILCISYLTSS